jgi:PAS domain S-box-containing protein
MVESQGDAAEAGRLLAVEDLWRIFRHPGGGLAGWSRRASRRKRKRRQERARCRSEQQFRKLFEHHPDAVFLSMPRGEITAANPAACELFGLSEQEICRLGREGLLDSSDPRLATAMEERKRVGRAEAELTGIRRGGERFPVEVSSVLFGGGKLQSVVVVRDISQRKRAEEKLRESELKYRRLLESIRDAFVIVDMQGRLLEFNSVYQSMVGYTAEELRQMTYRDLTPARWHASQARIIAEDILRHGHTEVFEKEYRRKDGTVFPVELRGFLVRDDAGEPIAMWGIVRDISVRKQAEAEREYLLQELRLRQQRLSLAMQAGRGGAWDWDLVSGKAWWSPEMYELWDIERDTPMDLENSLAVVDPRDREGLTRAIADAIERHVPLKHEYRIHTATRGERWMAVLGHIHYDSTGRAVRSLGITMDVTERKLAEEASARAKIKAEAANKAKSQFLANMSHEIRTPMTAILGYTELLMQSSIPEEDRQYLEVVHRNAQSLLQLINDILDLSKIEADKVHLQRVRCSPHEVVEEVLSLMRVRADEKHLSLEATYQHLLPAAVSTDPERLRQILVNLVGNAIKFTQQGGVQIRVEIAPQHPARLQFAVSDTGIGIQAEDFPKLFEPFSQVDSSFSRRHGGTGLGLALSQRLAHMLGGGIEVESKPGRGSTFTLSIDPEPFDPGQTTPSLPKPSAVAPSSIPSNSLRGQVLLVEDSPDNQMLLKLVLEMIGLTVDVASDGLTALKMVARREAEGRPYDLILMDIQMPGMDGYQTTSALRGQGWTRPILALTAHAMVGDNQKCLAAGCTDYIPKPVDYPTLLAKLAPHLRPVSLTSGP